MVTTMEKKVYVYQSDNDDDGNPLFAVETSLDTIPDSEDGYEVGVYVLKKVRTFRVKRKLCK